MTIGAKGISVGSTFGSSLRRNTEYGSERLSYDCHMKNGADMQCSNVLVLTLS